MSEKLERVLVIDDTPGKIESGCRLFGSRGRYIQAVRPERVYEINKQIQQEKSEYEDRFRVSPLDIRAGAEGEIAQALREETYKAILLDGYLELDLERECPDGGVIARKLREGSYGPKNKDTKILSTSASSRAIPLKDGSFCLPFFWQSIKEGDIHTEKAKELLE